MRNYTDQHGVDEDEMTISAQGGDCFYGIQEGITLRDIADSPSEVSTVVASLKNKD